MRICYHGGTPYYVCDQAHRRRAAPICNRASAQRVDTLVAELFLSVVNQETLEASLAYDQQLQAEASVRERSWQDRLAQQRYAADLARRRYELVDPANRLVAQTLERAWNDQLVALQQVEQAYAAQRFTPETLTSTAAELLEVITNLRTYWYAGTMSAQEQKELLRCLVSAVRLERQGPVIRALVDWEGGARTELEVPQYLFSSPAIYHRIRDLATSYPDGEIAAILQAEGLTTAKGRVWSARHVMDFRRSNGIPSGFTTTTSLRVPESGYLTSAEVATRLGIGQATVQKWYKLGILTGQHAGGQTQLWIHWTDDLEERLSGRASPDPRMVSVRALCRTRNQGPDAVLAWAQAQGHQLYRLRRGTAMRFYVLPGDGGTPAASAPPPDPARTLPSEVVALLAVLTAIPQPVRDLCGRLGMDKRALQTLLVTHQEVLLQQGVRFYVATRSEVAGAITLPSPLNAQEYTYYSRISWCQAAAHAGEDGG